MAVAYGTALASGTLLADVIVAVIRTAGSLPWPFAGSKLLALPVAMLFVGSLVAAVRAYVNEGVTPLTLVGSLQAKRRSAHLPEIPEFAGRRDELESLRRLVLGHDETAPAGPLVINIHGQQGTGKSVLALHSARELMARYPDFQGYVDFGGSSSTRLDAAEAADRLIGSPPRPGGDIDTGTETPIRYYQKLVRDKRSLIVLDNVTPEAQVGSLIPMSPYSLVLVTSRQPVDDLENCHRLHLDVMTDHDAVELLVRTAGDHLLHTEYLPTAQRIAGQCGHLPLALRLAGLQLRENSPRDVIARLAAERSRIKSLDAGNQDLRASFEVRYRQLSEQERVLFRRLRLVPERHFGAHQAAALVCVPVEQACDMLDRLVTAQMVESLGEERYRLGHLLGLYARERLEIEERPDERRSACERALRLYLTGVLRRAQVLDPALGEVSGVDPISPAPSLEEQLGAVEWFEAERPNLNAVWRQAVQIGAPDVAWRLAFSLAPFYELRGHRSDWSEANLRALAGVGETGGVEDRIWTWFAASRLRCAERRYDEARSLLEEALTSAESGGWRRLQARALALLGGVAYECRDLDEALAWLCRAATIFSDEGMVREQTSAMLGIAAVLHETDLIATDDVIRLGDLVIAALDEMPRDLWTVRTSGRVKECLSRILEQDDELEAASVYCIASMQAFRTIGLRSGEAHSLRKLAEIRSRQSQPAVAIECLVASMSLFRAIGDDAMVADIDELIIAMQTAEVMRAATIADAVGSPHQAGSNSPSLMELTEVFLREAGFDVRITDPHHPWICEPRHGTDWQTQLSGPIALVFDTGRSLDGLRVRAIRERCASVLPRSPQVTILAVVDQPPSDSGWLQIETCRAEGVRFIVLDHHVIGQGQEAGRQQQVLLTHMKRFLRTDRDLYDRRDPVADTLNFYGREAVIADLIDSLTECQPVLLIGLRKMGKSSTLRALHDRLPFPSAVVDLQLGASLPDVLDRVWAAWGRSARVKMPALSWPDVRSASSSAVDVSFMRGTYRLLSHIEELGLTPRLAILIDEADLIFPRDEGTAERYLTFARTLRGLVQEQHGRIALMMSCLIPSLNRRNRVGGDQNPFYQFFTERYLTALQPRECTDMISNIGSRMRLRYSDESLEFVAQASGGHPFLARQLCSYAFKRRPRDLIEFLRPYLLMIAARFVREPGFADLLDEHGLWGEMSSPHLWSEAQAAANVAILMSLADREPKAEHDLIETDQDRVAAEQSLEELCRRAVLKRNAAGHVTIQPRLLRDWIRRYKLLEDA